MMDKRYKVMTIIGTRPEIIRLCEVIKACDKAFDHILVHTGQNYAYELNEVFFEELGLRKPDYFLNAVGANLGETMGNVIAKSYDLIKEVNPDAVLILGDTNSALSAISAKRLKCPIFHMEAGKILFGRAVVDLRPVKGNNDCSGIMKPVAVKQGQHVAERPSGAYGKHITCLHIGIQSLSCGRADGFLIGQKSSVQISNEDFFLHFFSSCVLNLLFCIISQRREEYN